MKIILAFRKIFREGWLRQIGKLDEFSTKFQKGGGVIFNPKFMLQILGTLSRAFFSMKLIQKSNFRVQDMLFDN